MNKEGVMHRPRRKSHKKNGFTLLELMMVVIIIAILASIALPNYLRLTEKARSTEAINVLGAVRASEMRYRVQSPTNIYTNVLADLDYFGSTSPASFGTRWTNPVLDTTANTVMVNRSTGPLTGSQIGIELNTGNICGNFAPLGTGNCASN